MTRQRKASWLAAGIGAALAATCGMAMARGFGGHRMGGDARLFMLAKVAGVDHSQIRSALKGNTLKSDFAKVKTTHQALITCLASGSGACDTQISDFANAQQALTMDKYKAWETVFKGAPNASKASSFLTQMKQLEEQRHALFAQAMGKTAPEGATDAPPPPPAE